MKNRNDWFQACGSVFFLMLATSLGMTAFSGCGGGSAKSKSENAAGGSGKSPSKQAGRAGDERLANIGGTQRGLWTDKNGRKYFNKHPFEIWYKNAYEVASDQRPVGVNGGGKTPAGNGKKKPPDVKPPKSSGGWKFIAPIAFLEAEVKRIRNETTQTTNTIGRYRGNYKKIAYNGATLAAVAHIISVHPDKVTWKADALYVRDLGMKINESASGLGKKNYDATKAAVEQFVDILNRNKPAGLKEPDKETEFLEFAERAGIMKRMEAAFNWLQKEVNNEAKFKSESEQVVHEAAILGILAKCAGDASYDQADEDSYQKYVASTLKATQDIRTSVQAANFASFRSAIDVIQNNCNQCHLNHKNN